MIQMKPRSIGLSMMAFAYIKREGACWHPDEGRGDVSDDWYKRQLEGYCKDNGLDIANEYPNCSRPRLWQEDKQG